MRAWIIDKDIEHEKIFLGPTYPSVKNIVKNNCENFFKRKQTKNVSQLFFTKFFTTVFHNHFHGVKMFFTTSTRLHCGPTRRELGLPESSSDSARRRGGGEHATAQHTHTHTLDVKVRSVFLSIAGFFTAPGTRGETSKLFLVPGEAEARRRAAEEPPER